MSGTRPEEARPEWLPRSVLVLGLARSGRAAALALARRGVAVVAADRSPDADPGRLAAAGVELRLGSEEESLLEGVDLVVKSPGVPAESPLVAAGAHARDPALERGRARLPPARRGARSIGVTGTNGKTTTTELLGAILRAAGRAGRGRRQRRPRAHRRRRGGRARLVARLRAVELPARGRPHARLRRRRAAQPRARPPRPARHLRRLPRGEAPHLRARPGAASSRAGSASTGSSSPPTTRCPPSRACPASTTARTPPPQPPPRAPPGVGGRRDRRGAAHLPRRPAPARARAGAPRRPLGQRLEGDEHRRRPPRRRRLRRRSAPPDPRRLAQGRGLRALRARPAGGRSLDLPDRRRHRRARAALDAAGRGYVRAGDLATAVVRAAADAQPGDVVLLSPACASFDQFENFEHRGDAFRQLVEELA